MTELSGALLILGLVFGPLILGLIRYWLELRYAKKNEDKP
jgi:hypothetical protein